MPLLARGRPAKKDEKTQRNQQTEESDSMKTRLHVLSAAIAAVIASSATSHAAVVFASNRASIGETDTISWLGLGAPFTQVAQPFNISSVGLTRSADVSMISNNPFERRDQGNGWNGCFAPGAPLLWTSGNSGGMTIDFSSPVGAVGLQIQEDFFGPYTATIEAFDAGGFSLGSFNASGIASSNGDDSAVFVGVSSDLVDIDKIRLYAVGDGDTRLGPGDFAVNYVSFNDTTQEVPEPGQTAMMTLTLLGIGGFVVRRVALRRAAR